MFFDCLAVLVLSFNELKWSSKAFATCAFVPVAQESKIKGVNEGLGQFHIRKNRLMFCFRLCKKLPQSFSGTGTVDGTNMYLLLLESGLKLVLDTMSWWRLPADLRNLDVFMKDRTEQYSRCVSWWIKNESHVSGNMFLVKNICDSSPQS